MARIKIVRASRKEPDASSPASPSPPTSPSRTAHGRRRRRTPPMSTEERTARARNLIADFGGVPLLASEELVVEQLARANPRRQTYPWAAGFCVDLRDRLDAIAAWKRGHATYGAAALAALAAKRPIPALPCLAWLSATMLVHGGRVPGSVAMRLANAELQFLPYIGHQDALEIPFFWAGPAVDIHRWVARQTENRRIYRLESKRR